MSAQEELVFLLQLVSCCQMERHRLNRIGVPFYDGGRQLEALLHVGHRLEDSLSTAHTCCDF